MRNNVLISLLCNMIVIFVALYYIPFLGVFLIILRYIIYYSDNRKNTTSTYLLVLGAMLLMPKLIKFISNKINYSLDNVPYFNKLVESNIYNVDVVNYSKLLITVGIIYLVISTILSMIIDKTRYSVKNYVEKQEKKHYEITKENDMKMQEKREIAKNTTVVICPYCGGDNMFPSNKGVCKYCRKYIESNK